MSFNQNYSAQIQKDRGYIFYHSIDLGYNQQHGLFQKYNSLLSSIYALGCCHRHSLPKIGLIHSYPNISIPIQFALAIQGCWKFVPVSSNSYELLIIFTNLSKLLCLSLCVPRTNSYTQLLIYFCMRRNGSL